VNVAQSASGAGINSNVANGGNSLNLFANPAAVYNEFRPCVLGYDTSCGSQGQIRGMPSWNLDANMAKDFRVFRERVFLTLSFQFINVLNHVTLADPYLDLSDPSDFGGTGFKQRKRQRRASEYSAADYVQLAG
jgi:predicted amidohydrolase